MFFVSKAFKESKRNGFFIHLEKYLPQDRPIQSTLSMEPWVPFNRRSQDDEGVKRGEYS